MHLTSKMLSGLSLSVLRGMYAEAKVYADDLRRDPLMRNEYNEQIELMLVIAERVMEITA